jgi:hypothetical protein
VVVALAVMIGPVVVALAELYLIEVFLLAQAVVIMSQSAAKVEAVTEVADHLRLQAALAATQYFHQSLHKAVVVVALGEDLVHRKVMTTDTHLVVQAARVAAVLTAMATEVDVDT